jgi:hypothetical protein
MAATYPPGPLPNTITSKFIGKGALLQGLNYELRIRHKTQDARHKTFIYETVVFVPVTALFFFAFVAVKSSNLLINKRYYLTHFRSFKPSNSLHSFQPSHLPLGVVAAIALY